MAFSVQMPALGESVTEGTVTRWLKQEGDTVELDEPLVEVSTDKVDTEIPSPAAGVLTKIIAQEDDTVEVGGELAVIGDAKDAGEAAAPAPEKVPAAQPESSRHPNHHRSTDVRSACWWRCQAGADARARRIGDRGDRHSLAEEDRGFGSG